MEETVVDVFERNEKPKKSRKEGFIPGVVYGDDFQTGKPVKFQAQALMKVLSSKGQSGKLDLKIGENKKTGIIKEIQRDAVKDSIIHIDIQLINAEENVKMKVPLVFEGENKLGASGLILQAFVHEVEVFGKSSTIPEHIVVNVADKNQGDKIFISDIKIADGMKIVNDATELVAVASLPQQTDAGTDSDTDNKAEV